MPSPIERWSDQGLRLGSAWRHGLRTLTLVISLASLAGLCAQAEAQELQLQAPLTTAVVVPAPAGAGGLAATVTVPANAPPDLGVACWTSDRDGHWYQLSAPGNLGPGVHHLHFDFSDAGFQQMQLSEQLHEQAPLQMQMQMQSQPAGPSWTADARSQVVRCGLSFYSASSAHLALGVDGLSLDPAPAQEAASAATGPAASSAPAAGSGAGTGRLLDLTTAADPGATTILAAAPAAGSPAPEDGALPAGPALHTGERWQLELRPEPFPANPYEPQDFSLDATITGPGDRQWRIAGFCLQPMHAADRGDHLVLGPSAGERFALRFRPPLPGSYRVVLSARWHGGPALTCTLSPLQVSGPAWDGWVHIDQQDPRFFDQGGSFIWPIGINLHSPFDKRSQGALGTRLTPDRGALVYEAMLPRLAAVGVDACEIWMSTWNLGLEWRADWPGFGGIDRYNQVHAWELDRILDQAWSLGMRVNLVINNHGQASAGADREWLDNPWNAQLGGPLDSPQEVFTDPRALDGQERLRRYIIARWADHPAILGWKLWSEVDLTAARGEVAWRWHEQAASRWHALDPYHHPVTTHWAGGVNPAVAQLPGIDYLCIDAYRHVNGNGAWRLLSDILADGTNLPGSGLGMYRKPILTSEYGAGSGGSPESARAVDHDTGAWAALVSGHAGSPMLWWWEWVDQGRRWQPYLSIHRFIAGEDLRFGRAAILDVHPDERLWARAWVRHGRLLGYVLDRRWGADGTESGAIAGATLDLGSDIAAGSFRIEWWDAATGEVVDRQIVSHASGAFTLAVPTFSHHLALKVVRLDTPATAASPASATTTTAPSAHSAALSP